MWEENVMTEKKTHTHVRVATGPGKSRYLRKLIKDAPPGSIVIDPSQEAHANHSSTYGSGTSWSISPSAPPIEHIQPALTALADQLEELKDILSPDDRRQIRFEIKKLVKIHLNL
jgi:hypothetical protein